jgi:hypothetical protein
VNTRSKQASVQTKDPDIKFKQFIHHSITSTGIKNITICPYALDSVTLERAERGNRNKPDVPRNLSCPTEVRKSDSMRRLPSSDQLNCLRIPQRIPQRIAQRIPQRIPQRTPQRIVSLPYISCFVCNWPASSSPADCLAS